MSTEREKRDRTAARLDAMTHEEREGLYADLRQAGADNLALQTLDHASLREMTRREGLEPLPGATLDRLRYQLISHRARVSGLALGGGVLEVSPDGFGYLRARCDSFAPGMDDIYVSAGQLHHLGLRHGHFVVGATRPPREGELYFSLLRVETVNGATTRQRADRPAFESAMSVLPNAPLRILHAAGDTQLAAIAALAPWAHGSRVLIWAPEGRARLKLLGRIAAAIRHADPAVSTRACLLDAEPPDLAEFARTSAGCDFVAASFDESPTRQVLVAELALASAMRAAEAGSRVVLLLDSMTALARHGNRERPREGTIGPADVPTHALVRCKRMFAAARQLAEGGSLTVVATMSSGCSLPVEHEASAMFAQKGNSIVAFDSLDDDALPCVARTATRPEDLLLGRQAREELVALRERLLALPADARKQAFEP